VLITQMQVDDFQKTSQNLIAIAWQPLIFRSRLNVT
jgi:hypothetical protein